MLVATGRGADRPDVCRRALGIVVRYSQNERARQAAATACQLLQFPLPLRPFPVMVHPSAIARLVMARLSRGRNFGSAPRVTRRGLWIGLWRSARDTRGGSGQSSNRPTADRAYSL